MAKTTKTKSNAERQFNQRRWLGAAVIGITLLTLSACTNDYVSLDPIVVEPTPMAIVEPVIDLSAIPVIPTPTNEPTIAAGMAVSAQPTEGTSETELSPAMEVGGIGGGEAFPDVIDLSNTDPIEPARVVPTPMLASITKPVSSKNLPTVLYLTQAGDTLPGLAARYGVSVNDITSSSPLPKNGFLNPQMMITIPEREMETTSNLKLIPDSETVFSPSGLDFDIDGFVDSTGGYLQSYREYLNSSGWLDGAGVIRKVAVENSINPRVLLSVLEYFSHWVYGQPAGEMEQKYPLGHIDPMKKGLYSQLTWAVSQMNLSYYGWREGIVTEVVLPDGTTIKGAPDLNAGTFAMQYLFAQLLDRPAWEAAVYSESGYPALHQQMFGNPWLRAMTVEPLFPATVTQPDLILPIEKNTEWSFTGGPHAAWGALGARAALDFSPSLNSTGCLSSDAWVLAAASGVVARAGGGVVVLDLDGDGNEQTGWNILYMHIAIKDRVQVGDFLEQGQRLGHPSCEGGFSTGTHFHIARKFNGEWILAGGPLPFTMDGWKAQAAAQAYKGSLTKGDDTIAACTCGTKDTVIIRTGDLDNSNENTVQ
jgi:murein DD-endopeptidase MepM/ murein hydrolase activator NlpD